MRFNIGNGSLLLGDCLELMKEIPDGSVDMVLCDLPYGTTACKWDTIIPFEPLWEQYWRVCRGVIVLTAAQPFASALTMSQIEKFSYDWIWHKGKATGHLNAKKMPMRAHEHVLVFGSGNYFPQGTIIKEFCSARPSKGKRKGDVYGAQSNTYAKSTIGNYPRSVVDFSGEAKPIHPTQKPVALFEYLIKTYTNPGDLVLDNCAGSGTTAIAAERTERRWLCMEKELQYYLAASGRIYGEVKGLAA